MTDVGKDGSVFGVSQELDIDLSNYYTKAQAEQQKYSLTKNINMKNAYKLKKIIQSRLARMTTLP